MLHTYKVHPRPGSDPADAPVHGSDLQPALSYRKENPASTVFAPVLPHLPPHTAAHKIPAIPPAMDNSQNNEIVSAPFLWSADHFLPENSCPQTAEIPDLLFHKTPPEPPRRHLPAAISVLLRRRYEIPVPDRFCENDPAKSGYRSCQWWWSVHCAPVSAVAADADYKDLSLMPLQWQCPHVPAFPQPLHW